LFFRLSSVMDVDQVVEVKPLSSADAARLLVRRSPRPVEPQELGCKSLKELVARLASFGPLFDNMPGRIVAVAPKLNSLDLHTFLRLHQHPAGSLTLIAIAASRPASPLPGVLAVVLTMGVLM
jgi:hypothetical protein